MTLERFFVSLRMTPVENPKNILRLEAKRHQARFDLRSENVDAVTDLFFLSIAPTPHQVIAAYWPKDREFDTRPLLDELTRRKFTCALPIMQKDSRVLRFALWDDRMKLRESTFGIMEPAVSALTRWVEPDIFIVPMLAFDRRGYRLGHGFGYYDATLTEARKKKDVLAVGVAYAQQAVLFSLPVEDHDQKMDWIITPMGAQDFKETDARSEV